MDYLSTQNLGQRHRCQVDTENHAVGTSGVATNPAHLNSNPGTHMLKRQTDSWGGVPISWNRVHKTHEAFCHAPELILDTQQLLCSH